MKKNLFTLLIVGLFIFFVIYHFPNVNSVTYLLDQAKWDLLGLTIVLQIFYYFCFAYLAKLAFRIYNIHWSLKKILVLSLAALSTGVVTPLGSLAGTIVYIHRAKKDGYSGFSASAAIFATVLCEFVVIFIFLLLSIFYIDVSNKIFSYEIAGLISFSGVMLGIFIMLTFGKFNPGLLKQLLRFYFDLYNKTCNAFKSSNLLPSVWVENRNAKFNEISEALFKKAALIKYMLVYALGMHIFNMLTLLTLFMALGNNVDIFTVFVGYSFGRLLLTISPTPQGIGVVDSLMPLIFKSLGVDIQLAILIVLAYRALTLWLPAGLGFFALHSVVVRD